MELVFDTTNIGIAAGASLNLRVAFNGSLNSGGDYFGPVLADPTPFHNNQSLRISTLTSMKLSSDAGGLTSRTVYLFRVSNPNAFHVTFRLDFLINN
jgi:hypothetical protein